MLLMIKNHLNGTWFYELLKCYFRVHSIDTEYLVTFFNLSFMQYVNCYR